MARAFHGGRVDEALSAAQALVQAVPDDARAHRDLASVLASSGRFDEAAHACRAALSLSPSDPELHVLLGRILADGGRPAESCDALASALALEPARGDVRNLRAVLLTGLDRHDEAEAEFRHILATEPGHAEALSNLGHLLSTVGRHEEAAVICARAVEAAPSNPAPYVNLANALAEMGRLEAAGEAAHAATVLDPRFFEAHLTLGALLYRAGHLEDAEQALRRAVALRSDAVAAYTNLGLVLADQGRVEEALATFEAALAAGEATATPGAERAEALNGAGGALLALGRLEEAEARFREALKADPASPNALLGLASLRAEVRAPDTARRLVEASLGDPSLSPGRRMLAHFWLAGHHDRAGDYGAAFEHLTRAHRHRRLHHGHRYDAAVYEAQLQTFQDVLTPAFFGQRKDWGLPDEVRPIFVVGFPRSGTSLVEQILSSHPDVFGAGELRDLPALTRTLYLSPVMGGDWKNLHRIAREDAQRVGTEYAEVLRALAGDERRVVDKMPHNFENLWLAALLFPGATVLHAVRNPLDTCVSCFFQNFTRGHAYTDDLADLGHQYRYYQDMMEHWKAVLPVEIHDVVYEDLVTDPDGHIPALLDACGLPFDEACLRPHENRRSVRTASVTQVRRKVYTSSVERWRKYEPWLGELVEALGPAGR